MDVNRNFPKRYLTFTRKYLYLQWYEQVTKQRMGTFNKNTACGEERKNVNYIIRHKFCEFCRKIIVDTLINTYKTAKNHNFS